MCNIWMDSPWRQESICVIKIEIVGKYADMIYIKMENICQLQQHTEFVGILHLDVRDIL